MKYNVKKSFTHNNEGYDVGYWEEGGSTKVKVFKKDGTHADPYEFSVTNEIQNYAKNTKSTIDPFEELVKTAESYVRNNTWGEYLEAVKALEEDGK
jgi:Flp pilus assembly secretin CpaC